MVIELPIPVLEKVFTTADLSTIENQEDAADPASFAIVMEDLSAKGYECMNALKL